MSNLKILPSGVQAMDNAREGGFRLRITSFRVTTYEYGQNEQIADTGLKGTTLAYAGVVSAVEVVGNSSIRYQLRIPKTVPAVGSINLGEVGLFLDSGNLFAVGKFVPALVKESGTAYTVYVTIGAAEIAGILDVTVTEDLSLSRTNVDIMSDAKDANVNALIVNDAVEMLDNSYESPTIAVKMGVGDEEWGFVGMQKVARIQGSDLDILTTHSFALDINLQGFWLNNGESVIVQVVKGTGEGHTRTMTFTQKLGAIENLFECNTQHPFPNDGLDETSVITVWRSAANAALPDRRGVPSSQVLFAGENTHSASWDTSVPVPGKLNVVPVFFTALANQFQFTIPEDVPRAYSAKTNVLLFIDGNLKSFNDYSFYDNTLITSPNISGAKVSLYVFYRSDSEGANIVLYEELIELAQLQDYHGKPSFNTPFVVDSVNQSIGFNFGAQTGKEVEHNWHFDGAKLVFNSNPETDTLMLLFGLKDTLQGYSQPRQYEWTYSRNNDNSADNAHVFKLSFTPEDNYFLFVRGKIVPKRLYTTTNSEIRISKTDLTINNGDYVRFFYIANLLATNVNLANYVEPTKIEPNRIRCDVVSVTTPFTSIALPHRPINDNYVLVFAHRLKQDKADFWQMQGSNSLALLQTLPDNYPVDVVYFYEDDEPGTGYAMRNKVHTIKTKPNQNYYEIPYRCDPKSTILFVDTLYLHKHNYSLQNITDTTTTLLLSDTPVMGGRTIDVIVFDSEAQEDSRTDLLINRPDPYIGFRGFEIEAGSVLQSNTLLFIGATYQHKDDYRVRANEIVMNRSVPYAVLDPNKYHDLGVEMLTFASGRDLINIDLELAALAQVQKPARNTGPFWADPAGTNRQPNKMTVSVRSYVSSPSTRYQFTPPAQSQAIMVFVHGAFQSDDNYTYLSLGEIAFNSKFPDGYPVDIITFQSKEDEVGYVLDTKVFEIISNASNDYSIGAELTEEQNVWVFVEGAYFHKTWYKLVPNGNRFKLQFNQGLIDNLRIEVLIWTQTQLKGSYTECVLQRPNPTVGAKNIVLTEEVSRKNTMVFAGPVYQSKSTYKVNALTLQLDSPIEYHNIDPINFKELPTAILSFRTGVSKSRLVTRDELRSGYLTKFGGDLQGPLYTQEDPTSDSEVANKRYVDALGTKILELQAAVERMQGVGSAPSYAPVLSVAPNMITVGSNVTLKITNASPGKTVELEVRGSSGVFNKRSIKGVVKLDGSFSIGPVGIDNGYSDYLTITAWVDGFRVANTADIKVTDGKVISGPAMISIDKDIYVPYDYITYSIADATPGGRVTWSTNGGAAGNVPAGQMQFVAPDGTWSMQVPAGGVPTTYGVELFVDNISLGSVNVIVSPSRSETMPKVSYNSSELFRDEVLEVKVSNAKPYSPVVFSARATGLANSGPMDTVGLVDSAGELNFGMRFVAPGDYVIYISVDKKLLTHSLKVKQVSPNDTPITEQPDGFRPYIKQY